MQKEVPIIFQVLATGQHYYNKRRYMLYICLGGSDTEFKLPCAKKLLRKRNGGLVDVKINTEWQKGVSPEDFSVKLLPNRLTTILIKPHEGKYFAGWARWFNWEKSEDRHKIVLKKVISDPDYAHIKSEKEIGNNFRANQYSGCKNLEGIPPSDIDFLVKTALENAKNQKCEEQISQFSIIFNNEEKN